MAQATTTKVTKPGLLQRYIPMIAWLPQYQRGWLRPDFIAGLPVVALLVPEGMAYAELAGVPPETAFYAAIPALILYAIFGSSKQLVVAPLPPSPPCPLPSSSCWPRPAATSSSS